MDFLKERRPDPIVSQIDEFLEGIASSIAGSVGNVTNNLMGMFGN